ncbi:MAG: RIP metalloprotease RseP [Magnetococcales bacterium]|nr:RIP metalloprotease RseP [Magnetococcales bacterium]
MEILTTAFWALLVLGVLIFVHEMGHFLVARWCGVRVEVFSIGFGPQILSWTAKGDNGTNYRISAVPLGGFVKMLGESQGEGEVVDEVDRPFAFSFKPLWQRFAIVFAGPAFNFLFAIVAFAGLAMTGIQEALPVVGQVGEETPAAHAGLLSGDHITHINGEAIDRWATMSDRIKSSDGNGMRFTIMRESEIFETVITPEIREVPNLFGEPKKVPLIGVSQGSSSVMVQYNPVESLVIGVERTWMVSHLIVQGIWKMITQVVDPAQIGGPLLIAEMAGKTASQGTADLLYFMAFISINLGILNLLPIPILDGGHLFFFLIEGIKRTPVHLQVQEFANRAGLVFLVCLMVLAFYNDLVRLFFTG